MKQFISAFAAITCMALQSSPVLAQTVLSGDHSVFGSLCVGSACTNAESLGSENTLRLKQTVTAIDVVDTSAGEFPSNDWKVEFNDFSNSFFGIRDVTAGQDVFVIEAGAGNNALYVDDVGDVGLGTMLPEARLHIETNTNAGLRINRTLMSGPPQAFEFQVNSFSDLQFRNITANNDPMTIKGDALNQQLSLTSTGIALNSGQNSAADLRYSSVNSANAFFIEGDNGNVGLGTNTPEELLHIRSDAEGTDAFALFDANGAGSDAAFLLRQNGTTPTTWEFRNQQSSGKLNVGTVGGTKPFKIDNLAATNLLRLGLNGQPNVVAVNGELRVNNTALTVPDYVFADDYTLRPLADVRAFIDSNNHLPEVPSEADIKADGLNMTQMQMTLLKKVEELTLYTLEQEARIAELTSDRDAVIDAQAALVARLETLEANN